MDMRPVTGAFAALTIMLIGQTSQPANLLVTSLVFSIIRRHDLKTTLMMNLPI
jgi:hypothetical protein